MYSGRRFRGVLGAALWVAAGGAAAGLLLPSAASALEDPTRPAASAAPAPGVQREAPAPSWNLSYTLVAGERQIAIVNGRRVRPGQHVDGARVERIRPGEVQLTHNGRLMTLRLAPPVKAPPTQQDQIKGSHDSGKS